MGKRQAEIAEICKSKSADEIYDYLHSDGIIETEWKCGIALADTATLFTAIVYLGSNNVQDKNTLRKEAYEEFLGGNKQNKKAWGYIEMLSGGKAESGINLRILKGGSYKIKQYYLENRELKDIRGASILLTHVEETVIPRIISNKFIRECIVYCGGGNIFAILPESCNDDFHTDLENEARKLLISAGIAYHLSDVMDCSVLLNDNYNSQMANIENKLGERKKLIISNPINAKSEYIGKNIKINEMNVEIKSGGNGSGICSACGKRIAFYSLGGDNLCASCLHKRCVGAEAKHSKYINEYIKYTGKEPVDINCLTDIDREYISVVYGDGNNMGGIISKFKKITEMMSFSRDVKTVANKAVFQSMSQCGIDRFEVVGLGGDDVFVIVPGRKAYTFSLKLIEIYNNQFIGKYDKECSTMSVGIAIGKAKMPVRILLEVAEDRLSDAKTISKENKQKNCDDGSLAFTVMDTFECDAPTKSRANIMNTMQPYSLKTGQAVAVMAREFNSNAARSRLRNLLDAFSTSESIEEAALFFRYLNAKANTGEKVKIPEIPCYKSNPNDGYYTKDGKNFFIWDDLMNLLDYCEGE